MKGKLLTQKNKTRFFRTGEEAWHRGNSCQANRVCESEYKEVSGAVTIGHASVSLHYVKKKDMAVNSVVPTVPFIQ